MDNITLHEEFNSIIRNVVNDVLLERGLITESSIKTEEIQEPSYNVVDEVLEPSYNIVDEVVTPKDTNLSKKIYSVVYNFKVDKKFWTYDNLSGEDYDLRRSKPAQYIKTTIKIAQLLNLKTVVEIGSTRMAVTEKCLVYYNNQNEAFKSPGCCGDGHSTFFFTESGFNVYTVDIDENCKIQNEWSYNNLGKKLPSNLHLMIPKDGIEFLNEFDNKIDVLFLDGWDKGTPNYAEKHLEAYIAAKDKLSDIHLILIDDTDYITHDGGKDALLTPHLIDNGYIPLFNGRQTLFINTMNFH